MESNNHIVVLKSVLVMLAICFIIVGISSAENLVMAFICFINAGGFLFCNGLMKIKKNRFIK